MTFDYVVILRNTNKRSIYFFNLLLAIMTIVFLIYRGIYTDFLQGFSVMSLVFLIVVIAILLLINKKRILSPIGFFLLFAGLLILFNKSDYIYEKIFALGLIIVGAMEQRAKANLEIGFSTRFIMFDNLFKKKYNWSEFNNIVLKDNLLTLDFKNNKIFQRETIDEESDCDEDEFNAFCREQLRIANNK